MGPTVKEIKIKVNYSEKCATKNCGECASFFSVTQKGVERAMKCLRNDFATKRTGSCDNWRAK